MMICTFSPANFKGIVYLTPRSVFGPEKGPFAAQLSVLANCWKETFVSVEDPFFFYTMPDGKRAPNITRPDGIKGKSVALSIAVWTGDTNTDRKLAKEQLNELLDAVIKEAY